MKTTLDKILENRENDYISEVAYSLECMLKIAVFSPDFQRLHQNSKDDMYTQCRYLIDRINNEIATQNCQN